MLLSLALQHRDEIWAGGIGAYSSLLHAIHLALKAAPSWPSLQCQLPCKMMHGPNDHPVGPCKHTTGRKPCLQAQAELVLTLLGHKHIRW